MKKTIKQKYTKRKLNPQKFKTNKNKRTSLFVKSGGAFFSNKNDKRKIYITDDSVPTETAANPIEYNNTTFATEDYDYESIFLDNANAEYRQIPTATNEGSEPEPLPDKYYVEPKHNKILNYIITPHAKPLKEEDFSPQEIYERIPSKNKSGGGEPECG